MKKILLFITLISTGFLHSQMTFQLWNFNAKPGMESAIADLAESQWGDAKFKSGGIQVERIGHGDNEWSHRVILFGEIGKIGRVEGDVEDYEWGLFAEQLNNYVDEWGTSYAGRFLSLVGGAWKDFPYVQIYDLKLDDSAAFKKAHDKVVAQTSKSRGDRPVGFGTYDIGGGNSISHWVAVGYKNFEDLMSQKVVNDKYVKEWAEWNKNNGGAESPSNYTIQVLASYPNN